MKTKSLLTQFTTTRHALEKERDEHLAKAAEIEAALSSNNGHVRSESHPRKSTKNKASLREAVTDALKRAGRPLSKQEILAAIQTRGYTFTTNDPINSLGAMLYSKTGKREFTNRDGKFSAR